MTLTKKNLWALSALLIMSTGNIHAKNLPFPCPSEFNIDCNPCEGGRYTCIDKTNKNWTTYSCSQEFSSKPKSYKLVDASKDSFNPPRCNYNAYLLPDQQGNPITLNLQNHKVTDKCHIDTISKKGFVCPDKQESSSEGADTH